MSTTSQTGRAALSAAIHRLRAAGVPEPELSASYLLSAATNISDSGAALLRRASRFRLTGHEAAKYSDCISRRLAREPVQYMCVQDRGALPAS